MKTKKLMIGYLVFSILAGLGLATWRTILLYQYYDPYNGTFTLKATEPLRLLGYVMFALIVVVFTSIFFLYKQTFSPFTSSANHFSVFSGSLQGFLFIAAGILALIYHADDIFSKKGTTAYRAFLLTALVCLFFSGIYFILSASARYDDTKLKKLLSFFPTLFGTAYLGASYLAPNFSFSNSNDILRNVSLAALVFFFMQETRAAIYGKSHSLRFPMTMVMLICVLAYNLPMLIVSAFWEMELTYMTMFELVECGAVIYGIAVAISMTHSLESHTSISERAEETPLEPISESTLENE